MADDIELLPAEEFKEPGFDPYTGKLWGTFPKTAEQIEETTKGLSSAVKRGAYEAIPFVGERLANQAGLPEPKTTQERLVRRATTNLPFAPFSPTGYVGSVAAGQAAEEAGLPPLAQTGFEIVGGGLPSLAKTITGKMTGYIEPALNELYKKGKSLGYELDAGARAEKGMKYGAGGSEVKASRNLDRFTKEATTRAGDEALVVNADWINKNQNTLGNEAERIFSNKKFQPTERFLSEVNDIARKAQGAFGEQGNVVKNILEQNIGGKRPGGALVESSFNAKDLHEALKQVNAQLSASTNPAASRLLYELKESLESVAKLNLANYDPKLVSDFSKWTQKYNSFATIRDAFERAGSNGVTASGKINPKTLQDIIVSRTGGNPKGSPLYDNLAELGDILFYKKPTEKNLITSATQLLTENPLSKALQLMLQPKVPTKSQEIKSAVQAASPATRAYQAPANDENIEFLPSEK